MALAQKGSRKDQRRISLFLSAGYSGTCARRGYKPGTHPENRERGGEGGISYGDFGRGKNMCFKGFR